MQGILVFFCQIGFLCYLLVLAEFYKDFHVILVGRMYLYFFAW